MTEMLRFQLEQGTLLIDKPYFDAIVDRNIKNSSREQKIKVIGGLNEIYAEASLQKKDEIKTAAKSIENFNEEQIRYYILKHIGKGREELGYSLLQAYTSKVIKPTEIFKYYIEALALEFFIESWNCIDKTDGVQ
jgi:hypothetical protein